MASEAGAAGPPCAGAFASGAAGWGVGVGAGVGAGFGGGGFALFMISEQVWLKALFRAVISSHKLRNKVQ